ncbi:hypothetical protein SAMN05444369_102181 [Capnocytophaga haemolytica]|uniref:Uncharacterized protein n=1 Tax=Capnocytophaga haemolytica TaxID=45243 RepID=A0AAX2GWE7_9FLAO|nr:hypothetical protein SAMN05444369_102181 [Capnocytophaga haemolytica]SNV06750.1 Uncharacterised protein [Capnocytophaga haemolytica]
MESVTIITNGISFEIFAVIFGVKGEKPYFCAL